MIKFSVIVPLYNCEAYITECIDSILSQSYPHFEIIVVNDGSTDSSREIAASYTDTRVRIIDKENGGLLHARLTGIREAHGEYIVFVDADDRVRPDLLGDLAVQLESGADVAVYKLLPFSEKGYFDELKGIYPDLTVFTSDGRSALLKKLLTSGEINSIVCKSFKKDLIDLDEMEKYPRIAIGEDALFTLQIFKNFSRLVYLDRVYYDYRQFDGSMTHKLKDSNYTDNLFRFDLYYKIATEYFPGDDGLIRDVDKLFFRMTVSCTVNPRLRAHSRVEYARFVDLVRTSALFSEKMEHSYRNQSLAYKIVLKTIAKKRVGTLVLMRRALGILRG